MADERTPDVLEALRAILPLAEAYVRSLPVPSADYEQLIEDARNAIAEAERRKSKIIEVKSEEQRRSWAGRRMMDRYWGITSSDALGIMAAIVYTDLTRRLPPQATDLTAALAEAVDEAKHLRTIIEALEENNQ